MITEERWRSKVKHESDDGTVNSVCECVCVCTWPPWRYWSVLRSDWPSWRAAVGGGGDDVAGCDPVSAAGQLSWQPQRTQKRVGARGPMTESDRFHWSLL